MIVTTSARRTSKRANPDPVVLIRSSAYSSLPSPGNRVGPGDAANMPTIQATSGNSAIKTANGAHKYRLVGLKMVAPTTALTQAVVTIGGNSETSLANFPSDIIIDRCIVKGDTTVATRRGILLDGVRAAVIDSYVYDIKENNDTQAVWAYNTPGPIKVVNNYLEATGENLMTGGADPSYTNAVPSDIEIRKNYFKKQSFASWASSWSIKNLLEFKNAQRVLVEGNYFDTNYADSQNGFSLLITPRNQSGTAPWCVTQDITYRYNKLVNAEGGFNISGDDSDQTSERTRRISILHNVLEVKDAGSGSGIMRLHGLTRGPVDVQITNNTWLFPAGGGSSCGFHDNSPKSTGTIWRDNIFAAGNYGMIGTGQGEGSATFSAYFTSPVYDYNVMIGSSNTGSYGGTGNQFPANAAAVSFTDYAGGDYTLAGGSSYKNDGSDGNDPGANISALAAKILHSVDGAWGSADNLTSDRTYTNAELPREYVDTTYRAQGGTTWNCTTAAEFTTALAGCALGDTIVLTAGNTFTGSFTLRNI